MAKKIVKGKKTPTPALRETMERSYRPRSGLALGGIGTGSIELRKDGCFYNWTIFNNEPHGTGMRPTDVVAEDARNRILEDNTLFFIVRWCQKGGNPKMKLLQIGDGHHAAALESPTYIYPWMTDVDRIEYEASFPFTRMTFTDAEMPFIVDVEAFSPFIPHDVKNSALPAAIFNWRVRSTSQKQVDVMIMASLRNCIGYDLKDKAYACRIDESNATNNRRIVEMAVEDADTSASSWGTMSLAAMGEDVSHYAGWEHIHPYYELVLRGRSLPDIDDTEGRNAKDEKTGKRRAMNRLWSSVANSATMRGAKAAFETTFLVSWHFPNLYAGGDAQERTEKDAPAPRLEGHYYANFFETSRDVAAYVADNVLDLRGRTNSFHDDFFDSNAPGFVLSQINSHLNTFVTSSWLTKEGNFGIIEGLLPRDRRGPLATIDVGMYGAIATAALFPELDKSMMRAHERLTNRETGNVCHGIDRDFTTHDVREARGNRLDLPSQYVVMALRGYFWTKDRLYLEEMWPSVKAALEYVLRDRDANGDLLPDMEGIMCSYDNFPMYGAASYVASQWLAALSYATEAAGVIGDAEAQTRYSEILAKGRGVFEEKLWNGTYYSLYNDEGGAHGDRSEGCLTDQIIGQWATHHAGLDGILDTKRVRQALKHILKTSMQEYGLMNSRWPEDGWLHEIPKDIWVDQANTCWTGVELAFASFLIYEGLVKEGFDLIANVDARYRKAGLYFDHQEFGGHYYRAMSAWAIVNAMAGLAMRGGTLRLAPRLNDKKLKLFFVSSTGTAHYTRELAGKTEKIGIDVRSGHVGFDRLELDLASKRKPASASVQGTSRGRKIAAKDYEMETTRTGITLQFREALSLGAGEKLVVSVK